jgi:hypothetical protein
MISATPVTMTAPPTSIDGVIDSLRMTAPRTTATTGLT